MVFTFDILAHKQGTLPSHIYVFALFIICSLDVFFPWETRFGRTIGKGVIKTHVFTVI